MKNCIRTTITAGHVTLFLNHLITTRPMINKKSAMIFIKMRIASEGYQAYFKRFMNYILPLMENPKSALDFGCGATSLLANMMTEEGDCTVIIYDPIYHPDTSYRDKKYDLIVSVEVFEHLHHPKEVFEHLLSRLNEGGYLAIQTQFHDNDIKKFLDWYYRLDPTHIVFFRPETFSYLAGLYGCDYRGDNGKNMLLLQKASV